MNEWDYFARRGAGGLLMKPREKSSAKYLRSVTIAAPKAATRFMGRDLPMNPDAV